MKRFILPLVFAVLIFSTATSLFCQSITSAYDQLVYVNKEWVDQKDADPALKTTAAKAFTEQQLIQFHLEQVEKLLRKRDVCKLTDGEKQQRLTNLNTLHSYRETGVFPVNDQHENRQPYFIDKYNTYCAVGYLLKESGGDAVARSIHETQNFSYLSDIQHPQLMDWVQRSGLSLDELALIQPGYGDMTPASVTEFHYNNTGNDVNEYLEIMPDDNYPARKHLDSILFFNENNVLYKTLRPSQFQQFVQNGKPFFYYNFSGTDTFADRGRIELKGYVAFNPSVYFPMQTIRYNADSIIIENYDPYVISNPLPAVTKYNISENESTPVQTSMNLCTGSLQSLPATPGTLNSCIIMSINLSSLSYKSENNNINLYWQTQSESNTDYFVIERSNNGTNFTAIGKVTAAGTSNTVKNYSFIDRKPDYINHYRLKQVDKDGKINYSKLLYVKVAAANPLEVASTIVKSNLLINIKAEQSNLQQIVVYDLSGRQMISIKAKAGSQLINVEAFAAGKYLIRLHTADGKVYSQQFMKE